ncbi:hypothetical protein ACOME3_001232 [Neoechinorhynchus agilis]
MIVGRFIFGIHSGVSMSVAPVYVTEVSALSFQGTMAAIPAAGVTLGAFISTLLGVEDILGDGNLLIALFAIPIVVLIVQFICLFFCNETPKYLLLKRNDQDGAIKALKKLRNCDDSELLRDEIEALEDEHTLTSTQSILPMKKLFVRPYIKRTIVVIACNASQQLSGINAILFYSNAVFTDAGLNHTAATYGSTGVIFVLFLGSCISSFLMERAGRRSLLLAGYILMSVSVLALTPALFYANTSKVSAIFAILLQIIFVAGFSIGIGTIGWMIAPELFPFMAKPPAISVGSTVNWICNLIVVSTFLFMQRALGAYCFIVFGSFSLLFALFTYFMIPEIKNRTPEEIAVIFREE